MSPRTSEQFEEIRNARKQAILDAALHVFAEHGYHSASVSKIAKQAGVSKGLMYNYFESKQDLLVALMFAAMNEMEAIFPVSEPGDWDREKFIKWINVSIDIVLKDPQHWRLYFAVLLQPDVLPIVMDKMLAKAQHLMVALSHYFEAKGYEDPIVMMRYFSAVLDGVQFHCMMDKENFPAEQVKKLIINQFA